MTYAVNAGNQETIAGEMKQRTAIRKISEKRAKQLAESGVSLHFNSTIRIKPCNAITAIKHSGIPRLRLTRKSPQEISLNSISVVSDATPNTRTKYGKPQRRYAPINKQSAKQKARLQKLAAIRERWWREAQASGKPLSCGICDEEIRTREELASDHEIPGTFRDDSKIQPAHGICNMIKGSRRNFKIVRGDRNWKIIHGLL